MGNESEHGYYYKKFSESLQRLQRSQGFGADPAQFEESLYKIKHSMVTEFIEANRNKSISVKVLLIAIALSILIGVLGGDSEIGTSSLTYAMAALYAVIILIILFWKYRKSKNETIHDIMAVDRDFFNREVFENMSEYR